MAKIDMITLLNTLGRSHNLERLKDLFLSKNSELFERQEESLTPFIPAIGISLCFAVFERFLADCYRVREIFKSSKDWEKFKNLINQGWKILKLQEKYQNPSKDFYGWDILRNLHKLRHSMMHAYGRLDVLNSRTQKQLKEFELELKKDDKQSKTHRMRRPTRTGDYTVRKQKRGLIYNC